MKLPELGSKKDQLDTPILCVDLDSMENNIKSLTEACRTNHVAWRPHTKCHKSPKLAHRLLKAGAIGVTCAKLGEAEVMAAGGVQDILIANLIVGDRKVERLVELRKTVDPIVCVDHPQHVAAFGRAFSRKEKRLRVLIEVDIGLNRVGTLPGQPTLELARLVQAEAGLELAGIMGYEGHLLVIEDQQEKARQIHTALDLLVDNSRMLIENGVPCPIVSCGGTGSFAFSIKHSGITELQAGGGIFMDAFYRSRCQVTAWDYALTVLSTVVSRPAADRAIIDAGRKTMDANHQRPFVVGRQGITVDALSAEHGSLQLDSTAQSLQIGDRLEIVPGYSDMTCVLHDYMYGFRGNELEEIWRLEGRGRLQ